MASTSAFHNHEVLRAKRHRSSTALNKGSVQPRLPKLQQALKSLRMGHFLPHSASSSAVSSAASKFKPAVVDADDVIYYSNMESPTRHRPLTPTSAAEGASNRGSSHSRNHIRSSSRDHPHHPQHHPLSDALHHSRALEEVCKFYKSTPNFAELNNGGEPGHPFPLTAQLKHPHPHSSLSSTASNQDTDSPTDSGYRSRRQTPKRIPPPPTTAKDYDLEGIGRFLRHFNVARSPPPAEALDPVTVHPTNPSQPPQQQQQCQSTDEEAFDAKMHFWVQEVYQRAWEEVRRLDAPRLRISLRLASLGAPWPADCWMWSLHHAANTHQWTAVQQLIEHFGDEGNQVLGNEVLGSTDILYVFSTRLFGIALMRKTEAGRASEAAAELLQRLYLSHCSSNQDGTGDGKVPTTSTSNHQPPLIDPKYIDNPELSDIRFRLASGRVIYGHRIVLVTASERFRSLLSSPTGVVRIDDVSYGAFKLMLVYVYGCRVQCLEKLSNNWEAVVEVAEAAALYGIASLVEECTTLLNEGMKEATMATCAALYSKAKRYDWAGVVARCEQHMLSHLVEAIKEVGEDEGLAGALSQRFQKSMCCSSRL